MESPDAKKKMQLFNCLVYIYSWERSCDTLADDGALSGDELE